MYQPCKSDMHRSILHSAHQSSLTYPAGRMWRVYLMIGPHGWHDPSALIASALDRRRPAKWVSILLLWLIFVLKETEERFYAR